MKICMFTLCGLLLLSGCQRSVNDIGQFLRWANDSSHGLMKEKVFGEYSFKVKYLPPQYLVAQELSNSTDYDQDKIDSLYSYYSDSRTFLFTISPKSELIPEQDMLISQSRDYSDYSAKYLALSFRLQSYVTLHGINKTYQPVLTSMEQTTSLSNGRTFFLVFANIDENDELMDEEVLDIVFDDEIFNTGISHYRFYKSELDNIPEFRFLNKTK